jgi:hypothetical protein
MTPVMDRIALLVIATLTGLGAAFTIWLGFTGVDDSLAFRIVRSLAALAVIVAAAVTWRGTLGANAPDAPRLKRTALVVLVIGVVGLGANALVGSRTNDPDGPVFALSLLLILQAFVTIAYAGRTNRT